jgi:multiple sugar transport system permease protein
MRVGQERKEMIKTVLLIVFGIIIVSPLVLMLVSSLKDDMYKIMEDMGSIRAFMVAEPSMNNYREILSSESVQNFKRFFLNSIIILTGTVTGTLLISSMAGYTLHRGTLAIHKFLLPMIISLYIIPMESIMLPLMYQVMKWGISDTYIVQILPFIASPIYIFLFYQFFRQVPVSLSEAAMIEGASFWSIYWEIFLPINRSAVVTVAILQGMDAWNQYLWPLLVTQTERVRPMSVALASFSGTGVVYWDRLMAASVVMLLPVLVLFLFFQKFFIQSVASTAVKG